MEEEVYNPTTKNRYLYALNNPYKYSDPSGHYVVWAEEPGVTFRHFGGMLFSAGRRTGISIMYFMLGPGNWKLYTGGYQGVNYKGGKPFTGVMHGYTYRNGVFVGKYVPKKDSNLPIHNSFTNEPPTNSSGGTYVPPPKPVYKVPVIQAEKPSINTSVLGKKTRDLVMKAAKAQGISYQAMEQQLYAQLMAEGSGLDFPKFQNQQHLENRLQEMCNAIIDKNKKDKEDALLDDFQGILDWIGFVPGIGDVFDAVNAVIYAARGMYVLALISVACVIFSVYADVILKPIKKQ